MALSKSVTHVRAEEPRTPAEDVATVSLNAARRELREAATLDDIMKIVRQTAREITGADGAAFVLREGELCFYADEDAIGPLWKRRRFQMSACISGWSMINRLPVVVPDIFTDPRIPLNAYQKTFVKSLIVVPIRADRPLGAIGAYWAKAFNPPEEAVQYLKILAAEPAQAMQRLHIDLK